MTSLERMRRTGILCLHCLRNLAFYQAWNDVGQPNRDKNFWVNANGNFLDISVLEWCKVFADRKKGWHYYGKVVTNSAQFTADMLVALGISQVEFDAYVTDMKLYRDKFIAHLDVLPVMNIPNMDIAKNSAIFLYNHLWREEDEGYVLIPGPASARGFYNGALAHGRKVCSAA